MAYGTNTGTGTNTTPGGPVAGTGAPAPGTGVTFETETTTDLTLVGSLISVGGGVRTLVNVTQGYFSNGAGLLEGNNIHTGALSDSNEKYYFNVTNTHALSSVSYTHLTLPTIYSV